MGAGFRIMIVIVLMRNVCRCSMQYYDGRQYIQDSAGAGGAEISRAAGGL